MTVGTGLPYVGVSSMRYMLLIYMNEGAMTEAERQQCFVDSARLARDLHESGQFVAALPLQPVRTARSLRLRDGKPLVMDGPFAETREQLGGFYIIEARHLNEAIEIASRIPPAKKGTIEIRPILDIPGLPAEAAP